VTRTRWGRFLCKREFVKGRKKGDFICAKICHSRGRKRCRKEKKKKGGFFPSEKKRLCEAKGGDGEEETTSSRKSEGLARVLRYQTSYSGESTKRRTSYTCKGKGTVCRRREREDLHQTEEEKKRISISPGKDAGKKGASSFTLGRNVVQEARGKKKKWKLVPDDNSPERGGGGKRTRGGKKKKKPFA